MPDTSTLTALRRTRPDHQKEFEWHTFLWDAYTGGGGFEGAVKQPESTFWGPAAEAYSTDAIKLGLERGTTYLDKHPREDDAKFTARQAVAHYLNYIEPIIDLKLSFLLAKGFTVEGLPDEVEKWAQDVDGDGHTMDDILRDVVAVQAAVLGYTPTVMDMPPVDGVLSKAQAREAGVRPYLMPSTPVSLLDWKKDKSGRLEWAKVRTIYTEQASPLELPTEVEEITFWYPDRAEVYRIKKSGSAEGLEGPEVYSHPFEEVPVIVARRRPVPLDPVRGLPMDKQVAVESRRLFNLSSELDEHLRGQVFAILQVPTEDPEKLGEITIGVHNAVPVSPHATQGWSYIAPPASVAATYETRIENTVRELYRMARTEYDRAAGGVESGEARSRKFKATNRAIADFAGELARYVQRIYVLAGRGLGVSKEALEQIRVSAPQDFDVEELSNLIKNSLDAMTAQLGPTANARIRKRLAGSMLPAMTRQDREQVDMEIDELAKLEAAVALQFDAEISRGQTTEEEE